MGILRAAFVLAVAGVSVGGVWAQESAAPPVRKRVDCRNGNSFSPFIRVRGQLWEEAASNGIMRGTLRINRSNVGGGDFVNVYGRYVQNGNIEFAELEAVGRMDIDEIYIDFKDNISERSYVVYRNGAFVRMSCRVSL